MPIIQAIREFALVEITGTQIETSIEITTSHEILDTGATCIGSTVRLLITPTTIIHTIHTLPSRRHTFSYIDDLILPVIRKQHIPLRLASLFTIRKVELISLEEVPKFASRIYNIRIVGVPMSLTINGDERNLRTIHLIHIASTSGCSITHGCRIRANHLRIIHITTFISSPLLDIIVNSAIATSGMVWIAAPFHDIISRAMDVHNRHMAWSHRGTIIHRNTTHRTKGSNNCSQFGHTVISHHTAHGKAREVDTVLIYMIFLLHGFHDGFDEFHISRTRDIPEVTISLRIDHQDFSRIRHLVPMSLVHLIIGILTCSMHRDDHRSLLGQIGRHIYQHLSGGSTHLHRLLLRLLLIAMFHGSQCLQTKGAKQAQKESFSFHLLVYIIGYTIISCYDAILNKIGKVSAGFNKYLAEHLN